MWWAALLNSLLGTLSSGVAASTSSYESIQTLNPTTGSSSITFNSIPSTYKDLQIRFTFKDQSTIDYNSTTAYIYYRLNSDSGTNYANHYLIGNGSSASAGGVTSANGIRVYGSYMSNGGSFSDMRSVGIIDISDYASTTKNKTTRHFSASDANGAGTATNRVVALSSGLWLNTNAITSITLYPYDIGFQSAEFALYGIKGA
jgi:uncharacterized protein YqkB